MKKLDIKQLETPDFFLQVDKNDRRYIHCRVLIVCEGKKTEPYYFRSFEMMQIKQSYVFEVECDGGGINTMTVVDKAIEMKTKAEEEHKAFDAVWVVFDKDSFDDATFDNAINRAASNGIGCAWSNEAFELWYIYHFENRVTAMSRKEYKAAITRHIRNGGLKDFTYEKQNNQMRKLIKEYGGDEAQAIKYAESQAATFTDRRYHTHNPATMVFKLVRLLRGEDKEFNAQIRKSLRKN